MVTLNQIANFLALANELHFARTAEKLGITQAALSADIRKLETELNCQLFDRSNKWDIRLTASGSAYYEKTKELPPLLESAKIAAERAARGETGTLSIMVHPSVYNNVNMSEILREMVLKWPDVKLKIIDCVSDQAVAALNENSCDIAFFSINRKSVLNNHLLRYKEMFRTPFVFVIPLTHRLAKKKILSIQDFRNCRFILPPISENPGFRQYFEELLIQYGNFKPLAAQEARGPLATQNLVAAGLGIGILPESLYNAFPDQIIFRRFPVRAERTIVAAWMENKVSPPLHNFLSLLQNIEKKTKKKEKNAYKKDTEF